MLSRQGCRMVPYWALLDSSVTLMTCTPCICSTIKYCMQMTPVYYRRCAMPIQMTPVYRRCAMPIQMTATSSLLPIKQWSGQNGTWCPLMPTRQRQWPSPSFVRPDCQVPPISRWMEWTLNMYLPSNCSVLWYQLSNVGSTRRRLVWKVVSQDSIYLAYNSQTCRSFHWRRLQVLQYDD